MTAASLGPGPDLFSILSSSANSKTRRETFVLSLLGQAAILALIVYLTPYVIHDTGRIARSVSNFPQLPLIFSGRNGGGGGNFDPLPASNGNPPRASLETQIVPPTVIVPKEMPKLPVEQTVVIAPDVKFPQAGKIGALSPYTTVVFEWPRWPRRHRARMLQRNRPVDWSGRRKWAAWNLSRRQNGSDDSPANL